MKAILNPALLKRGSRNVYGVIAFGMLLATVTQLVHFNSANAAFTKLVVRTDRMTTSTATTGMVCATQSNAGTSASVKVQFPTNFTVNVVANWTTSTTNTGWPTGAVAWPGIGAATNVTGQVVTFPSTASTPGTLYCFNWNNSAALTTPASASTSLTDGLVTTYTGGATVIDQSQWATSAITNDQIAVSATVPPSFSFALSANTDALGTIATGTVAVSPTPRVVTISTNAHGGWNVWAKDSNTGLASAAAAYTVASTTPGTNSTLAAGTEGYNTGITSTHTTGSGTITVAVPFVGGSTGKGGGLNTTFATLATSSGTAAGDTVTLTNNAAISALTPAGNDYTDTITVVGAGNF